MEIYAIYVYIFCRTEILYAGPLTLLLGRMLPVGCKLNEADLQPLTALWGYLGTAVININTLTFQHVLNDSAGMVTFSMFIPSSPS